MVLGKKKLNISYLFKKLVWVEIVSYLSISSLIFSSHNLNFYGFQMIELLSSKNKKFKYPKSNCGKSTEITDTTKQG